jgi:hypothetical protein
MTRAEVTAFIAEKLCDVVGDDGDRVLQCEPESGTFIYYDCAQTVYDAESEATEPELWLVSVAPARAVT